MTILQQHHQTIKRMRARRLYPQWLVTITSYLTQPKIVDAAIMAYHPDDFRYTPLDQTGSYQP